MTTYERVTAAELAADPEKWIGRHIWLRLSERLVVLDGIEEITDSHVRVRTSSGHVTYRRESLVDVKVYRDD